MYIKFFLIFFSFFFNSLYAYHIGLCIMATGKYIKYADDLICSARNNFCKKHKITYFVFTDNPYYIGGPDVVITHQKQLGWPYDTLKRFHTYYEHRELYKNCNYIYAIDADMLIVNEIGDEILGDLVATCHPGYLESTGPYDRNIHSQAYVKKFQGTKYFCGGFYGANRKNFLKLLKRLTHMVDIDLSHNYIAKWHDESYLNRYFLDYRPTLILPSSYCYPEKPNFYYSKKLLKLPKKIIARDKNHTQMRKK